MSPFPEESLELTREQGAGYFLGRPDMLLKDGQYRIIRKLGYGRRSSVWLVVDLLDPEYDFQYNAVKILTAYATETSSSELEILEVVRKFGTGENVEDEKRLVCHDLPRIQNHFMEKSVHGEHLCMVLNLLGPDVGAFQRSMPNKVLPVYAVKVIIASVMNALNNLHNGGIIHGAVKPDNFLFWAPNTLNDINRVLSSSRVEESEIEVGCFKYPVLRSQPIPVSHRWDDDEEIIERGYSTSLSNIGHAKYSKTPTNVNGDIQAMGSATYELLTGKSLPVGSLELSAVELALTGSEFLHSDDIAPSAVFIHACLQNTSTEELIFHDWLNYYNRIAKIQR